MSRKPAPGAGEPPPPLDPDAQLRAWAAALWERSPEDTFRRLADRLNLAMNLTAALYREARARRPRTEPDDDEGLDPETGTIDIGPLIERIERDSLIHIRPDLHEQLSRAVVEAQALWCETPACHHLSGTVVVYLDAAGGRGTSGASFHELALCIISELCRALTVPGYPAAGWVDDMHADAGGGTNVPVRLKEVATHVRAECQAGIGRWGEVRPIPNTDNAPASRKRRIPREEANQLVSAYLSKHAKAARRGDITVRMASEATGVSLGMFAKLSSWQVYKNHRDKSKSTPPRTIPLTEGMLACVPDGAAENPANLDLEELIREQREDDIADERHRKRRRA